MKLMIDMPEETYNLLQNGGVDWLGAEHILDRVANGIPLEDKTNGEVMKTLFPHIEIKDNCDMYYSVDIENLSIDKSLNTVGFKKDWWDAPYKENKE